MIKAVAMCLHFLSEAINIIWWKVFGINIAFSAAYSSHHLLCARCWNVSYFTYNAIKSTECQFITHQAVWVHDKNWVWPSFSINLSKCKCFSRCFSFSSLVRPSFLRTELYLLSVCMWVDKWEKCWAARTGRFLSSVFVVIVVIIVCRPVSKKSIANFAFDLFNVKAHPMKSTTVC